MFNFLFYIQQGSFRFVLSVADNFKVIGTSGNIVTAIAHEKNRLYGFQFHPEVTTLILGTTRYSLSRGLKE